MSRLFAILLRILFPLDLVARSREIMRAYFQQITGWLADPLDREAFEESPRDRANLESHIIAAEQHLHLLIHERAREMLGLPFVYVRRQPRPILRKAKSLSQLYKRLTQIARNFHNLDKLAARVANRLKRDRDSNPLHLDAPHQATALDVLPRRRRGRSRAHARARDGGGCASSRGSSPWRGCHTARAPPFRALLPIAG